MTSSPYQFADVNGARLRYQVAGTGHPLVLIHAGICALDMWDEQMAAFSEHYQVIRYDMRGFGQSPPVAGTFARHEDLRGLLDHLDIGRAHLVGCSMGGTTALDFTVAYPERVSALVTVCSTPSGYEPEDEEIPPLWDEILAADEGGEVEKVCELEVQLWVDGVQRTPGSVDDAIRARVYAMNLIALQNDNLVESRSLPLEPRACGRLSEIAAPTLAIVGALDFKDIGDAADLLMAEMADARKVVIPGVAHLPSMEKPTEFNQIVLDFLQGSAS